MKQNRHHQVCNQLGTPEGAKSFLRRAQVFWQDPILWTASNSFELCPTHFSRGGEIFLRAFRPPAPPWLRAWHYLNALCHFGSCHAYKQKVWHILQALARQPKYFSESIALKSKLKFCHIPVVTGGFGGFIPSETKLQTPQIEIWSTIKQWCLFEWVHIHNFTC